MNFRATLEEFTWWLHTLEFSLWACVSLYIALLVHCIHVSACWCLSHPCNHVLVMLKIFSLYVLVVFAMKAFVALTNRVTFAIAQMSYQSWTKNHECHAYHLHRRSVTLNMCVWMVWVMSSSICVSVCSYDHLCIFWLFTHLVILLRF